MKIQDAVPGRWIECGTERRFIVGLTTAGVALVEDEHGVCTSFQFIDWSKWSLLPPECDSFDWQPETFPQYWTARPEVDDAVFLRVNEDWSSVAVYADGSESDRFGWLKTYEEGRKRLTESEAFALLDKPEPEPAKPATRKVVLTELLIVCPDGTYHTYECCGSHGYREPYKVHTIGTREIEVPL